MEACAVSLIVVSTAVRPRSAFLLAGAMAFLYTSPVPVLDSVRTLQNGMEIAFDLVAFNAAMVGVCILLEKMNQ